MRTVEDYLRLPYTFEIVRDPDGSFFISVKELKGCMTVADSFEEAHEMIKDAMEAWIRVTLENGQEIPEPEGITTGKDFRGKFVIRTPKELHKELAQKAQRNGVSLNSYVVSLLSRKCGIIELKDEEISSLRSLLIGEEKAYESSGCEQVPNYQLDQNVMHVDFSKNCILDSEVRDEN